MHYALKDYFVNRAIKPQITMVIKNIIILEYFKKGPKYLN